MCPAVSGLRGAVFCGTEFAKLIVRIRLVWELFAAHFARYHLLEFHEGS